MRIYLFTEKKIDTSRSVVGNVQYDSKTSYCKREQGSLQDHLNIIKNSQGSV